MSEREQLDFEDVVLDRAATQAVTDDAIERNESHLDAVWAGQVVKVLNALVDRLGPGATFTIDHVWEALGEIPTHRADSSRIGPIMRQYAGFGRIVCTDRTRPSQRPKTHGKPQREWRIVY